MIEEERVRILADTPAPEGQYVLYWMQASQRTECNHALEYAVQRANEFRLPLIVLFVLTPHFPEANLRHYQFMIEGLEEVSDSLRDRGISFRLEVGDMEEEVPKASANAAFLVIDRGYLRVQRNWRDNIVSRASCPIAQVESDVVVPVETASPKQDYSAGTFRPRISKHTGKFLVPFRKTPYRQNHPRDEAPTSPRALLDRMKVDASVPPTSRFTGGYSQARRRLRRFISNNLDDYADKSNDPSLGVTSELSPYLHFGQISPLEIALAVSQSDAKKESKEAFLEQLIVRRELSMNFVFYCSEYDSFDSLPDWARKTLSEHRLDHRPVIYSERQLENADTGDPYWNAAQTEMAATGMMHNYMRMYWGKKVLEWTRSPAEAFDILLRLNNKYELDGRDPNSYAGVAWCFGKHDRAWTERPIFGKVRYMNASGLKRKFDIDAYVDRVKQLVEGEQ